MKIPSKEELNDYVSAITWGGLKGGAIGLGLSAAGTMYLTRMKPHYIRNKTTFAKTFFFMFPVLACGVTSMEIASQRFDQSRYGWGEMSEEAIKARAQLERKPFKDRALDWCGDNRYKIIAGAWAASMAGSFWWINRDKYMTKAQKIVQARMYAQGLTVVLLLASMAMTGMSAGEQRKEERRQEDAVWQDIIKDEEAKLRSQGVTEEQMHSAPAHKPHVHKSHHKEPTS
uniref:ARAD1B15950p n=1 Tax=Blastobotrys adeninivorans TaxID=409370 RepID=A0A060T619_BLAAD